jgi:hypothetical protein
MAEQLKTDKDLDKELSTWHDRSSADWIRNYYRKEVIKHIQGRRKTLKYFSKELNKLFDFAKDSAVIEFNKQDDEVIEWIKMFFNITEEELR